MNQSIDHYYAMKATSDGWKFKVYHYDATGTQVIRLFTSEPEYETREEAAEAAVIWCEEHDIDADSGVW